MTRPYWQTRRCPEWCTTRHTDADIGEDRRHESKATGMDLPLDGPIYYESTGEVEPNQLFANLSLPYRAAEPHVQVWAEEGKSWLDLTLEDAEVLAHTLTELVRTGRGVIKYEEAAL